MSEVLASCGPVLWQGAVLGCPSQHHPHGLLCHLAQLVLLSLALPTWGDAELGEVTGVCKVSAPPCSSTGTIQAQFSRAVPSAGWPESTSMAGFAVVRLWFAMSSSASEHPSLSAEQLL